MRSAYIPVRVCIANIGNLKEESQKVKSRKLRGRYPLKGGK
jgi:hypothetical protein